MLTNKYQGYKDIDFLKDEDFLRWNLFQLKEDNEYWENIQKNFPDLTPLIDSAIDLYKSQVRLNDYFLSSLQIDNHHVAFRHRIKQQKKRKRLYYWLSGAASVLLLLAVNYLFKPFAKEDSKLVNFVKSSSFVIDSISEEIQLYVSANQMISIYEKEADIVYNTDSIRVDEKSLAEVNASEYSRLVVPKGKRSKLFLSDGTTLHVNSGSKVVYPNHFSGNIREIYVDGEVFLDVAHNSKQPFVVRTKEIAIRVTGTEFNVQAYEEDMETQVVLVSGGVEITHNNYSGKTDLTSSQMYDYREGQASVKHVDVEKYISWVHGMIYVEDERLDILMTKLSRYYGEKILFDERLGSQKCTGKVDLKDDLGDVLNGLTFSFPIKVEQEGRAYRVNIK